MIKYFCDSCKKEIEGVNAGNEFGTMSVQEKGFDFKKRKAEPIIRRTDYVMCITCIKKIREYAQGLQKEEKEA